MAKKLKKAGKKREISPIEKKILAQKTVCPACRVEINLNGCVIGQLIECADCGAELEVVKKGLKLDVEYIEHEEEKQEIEAPEYEESD